MPDCLQGTVSQSGVLFIGRFQLTHVIGADVFVYMKMRCHH